MPSSLWSDTIRPALEAARDVLAKAGQQFLDDEVELLSASLAFFTTFALAPLLVIAVVVLGVVFGEEAAQGQVVAQLDGVLGAELARFVSEMLQRAQESKGTGLAVGVSLGTMLFSASKIFRTLRTTMNLVWNLPKRELSWGESAWEFFQSLAMVPLFGVLIGAILITSALLSGFAGWIDAYMSLPLWAWRAINFATSWAVITILFGGMYRVLPDHKLSWRKVWQGAAVASLLFGVSKDLIGWYLGRGTVGSAFGAAGTLAVLLMWFYLSAQIFFFGAELAQVLAERAAPAPEPAEAPPPAPDSDAALAPEAAPDA